MKKKIRMAMFILLLLVMARTIEVVSLRGIDFHGNVSDFEIENQSVAGQLRRGDEIAQTFTAEQDFQGVSVLLATYGKTVSGKLNFELIDCTTDEVVYRNSYWAAGIPDNKYYKFVLDDKIPVSEPTQYKMVITSDRGRFVNALTAWISEEDMYREGKLYLSGEAQTGDLVFNLVYDGETVVDWGLIIHRVILILLLSAFLGLHCFLDIPKMYGWIFQKRVWIALAVFVFLLINKYNFSSMEQYDSYIQTDTGSEYGKTVFGTSRAIRSDEWMVSIPRLMTAEYEDYGKYNGIVRGTTATNLSASGLYFGISALAKPANWGFYLFGSEYGISFLWCFNMVFGFLFSYELCLILSKRKKLLALMGGALLWFSSYNMWWSTVSWLLTGEAALVFLYYFLAEPKRRKRLLYGIGIAVFGANFVVDLYPAWQVPAGYIFLAVLVWMFAEHWKSVKKYKAPDWGIAVGCIVLMAGLAGIYLYDNSEYLTAVTNTVYPGGRVSYGGNALGKLFGYLPALLLPWTENANPSEMGCFFSLFPLPYIAALLLFLRNKKKDLLTGLLLAVTTVLTLYCTLPLPPIVAKASLLTYSTPERVADIVGFAQVLLLIMVLGRYQERLKWQTASVLSGMMGILTFIMVYRNYHDSIRVLYLLVLTAAATAAAFALFFNGKKAFQNGVMIGLTVLMLVTGLVVNPLMCGVEAITGKPVAKEVNKIVSQDKEGKWIALDSVVAGNFLIACGAPTINSVNYVPNMDLWKLLDPKGENDKVYNRYAHIQINLTDGELQMGLKQEDYILLDLPYQDLKLLNVNYIYSSEPQESSQDVHLKEIYNEYGSYIYQVSYGGK